VLLRIAPLAIAWLLVGCDAHDPASAEPAGDAAGSVAHSPGQACAGCHPQHVREWEISPHAYAVMDPVFHAMVRVGQADTEGALGDFCVQCHTPIGARAGETPVTFDAARGVFVQQTEGLSPEAMAGVSCEVCHSMTAVEATANARFEMTHDGVRRATIQDPVPSPAHPSAYSPLHRRAEMCGTCHQVVNDFGLAVETTHREWVQSRFNGAQSCQNCHMPAYDGRAAVGGPERRVHRHTFVGVDVSLLPPDAFPGYEEMRELTTELLRESAELEASYDAGTRTLGLVIRNLAGHALPSGATMDREMWVELLVTDPEGRRVFESGTLDERGDLRVSDGRHTTRPGTDPQLVLFTQRLYFDPALEDPTSTEPRRPVEFLWEPNVEESRLVPAGGSSRAAYDLGALPPGAYSASVRLLFRSFPPHLLRLLEERGGLDPAVKERVPLVEMEATVVEFAVDASKNDDAYE
jgi:hypothetical protein